ncbi:MAG: hypothetical protein RLZZ58_824, partial [Pseudomonadota bacterium]
GMMLKEPDIPPAMLAKVAAPTLVLASDHDLVRIEHIVTIYKSLPNAQLAIFPNRTHMIPYDDPKQFNGIVEHFLATPFKKIDLIPQTMGSFEKMTTDLLAE